MSALFNQTNISPGTAFVSGGGSNNTSNFPSGIVIGSQFPTTLSQGNQALNINQNINLTTTTASPNLVLGLSNILFQQANTATVCPLINYDNATNTVNLSNVGNVNGSPYPPTSGSPLTFLIRPETNSASTLASGENYFSSLFSSPANLDANSVYRLTFKGTLSWEDTPTPSDWAQLYVQLASGMPPDDTRITPIMPYVVYTNGGNITESVYLETLLRSTDATTLDLIMSLNNVGTALYTLRLTWLSLQKIGAYT